MYYFNFFRSNQFSSTLFIVILGLFISACTTTKEEEIVVTEAPVVEPAWMQELRSLSSGQLEVNAINALLRNDELTASRNLRVLLEREPNSRNGKILDNQIELEPEEILGSRFVVYPALKGESLMGIAERFTGNRLNFYSLAKFNDMSASMRIAESALIKVPNKGAVGTVSPTIKNSVRQSSRNNSTSTPQIKPTSTVKPLPKNKTIVSKPTTPNKTIVSKPVEASPAVDEPEVIEKDIAQQAEELFSSHQYAELISLRNSNDSVFSGDSQLTEYVAASYLVLSEKAFAGKDMASSSSYLNEAKQFNLPPSLSSRALNLESRLQVIALLDKAASQKQQGQLEQSLYTYQAIEAIEPNNSKALSERKKVIDTLTKTYYQESIVSRGNFDYKSELSWLDKILKIDPSHSKSLQRKPIVERLVDQLN